MSDIEKKHFDASVVFNSVWKKDRDKLREMHLEFMKEIKSLMWAISNEENFMDSSYEAEFFLDPLQKIIKQYQDIYHIVSVTSGWEEDFPKLERNNNE